MTSAAPMSNFERERAAGRAAAIERTRAAAREIVRDLEASWGVHALPATMHAVAILDEVDAMAQRSAGGGR